MRTLLLLISGGHGVRSGHSEVRSFVEGPEVFLDTYSVRPPWSLKNKHTVNTDNTLRVGPQYG
jgi:hypothetical protein